MATPKRGSVDLILSDIALAALEALLQKKSWSYAPLSIARRRGLLNL